MITLGKPPETRHLANLGYRRRTASEQRFREMLDPGDQGDRLAGAELGQEVPAYDSGSLCFTAAGADFLEHGAVTARRCADGDGFPMCRECVAACIATAHHGDGSCRRRRLTIRADSPRNLLSLLSGPPWRCA